MEDFKKILKKAEQGDTTSMHKVAKYLFESYSIFHNKSGYSKIILKIDVVEVEALSNFFVKTSTDKILEMYNQDKEMAAEALYVLAQVCDSEFSLPEDDYEYYRPDENAIELFKKADELNHKYAAQRLATLYWLKCNGMFFEEDFKISHKYFERAASFGITNAMYNTGMGYLNFDDYENAVKWLQLAAKHNYPDAFNSLGEIYLSGKEKVYGHDSQGKLCVIGEKGVEKNLDEAIKFFRKGAELGVKDSMHQLGDCYMHGEGVEQDESEALKWFIRREDGNESKGMYHLGSLYGWDANYKKSFEWYSKSAALGNSDAIYALGYSYEKGEGVEKDSTKALEYYLKVAEQDDSAENKSDGIHGVISLYLHDEKLKNIPAALKLIIDSDIYFGDDLKQIADIFLNTDDTKILEMYNQDKNEASQAINKFTALYKEEFDDYLEEYKPENYVENLNALHKKAINWKNNN